MRAEEFIQEIVSTPPSGSKIEAYQYIFNNIKTIDAFNNLTYAKVNYNDSEYYGLLNNKNILVSILIMDLRDNSKYYQVTYTESLPEYRRQGCFRYLLLKSIEQHSTILSDERQTKDAEESWKSLIQYPSERIQFYMYNISKDSIEPVDITKIWNNTDDYTVMATNKHVTTEMLERSKIRDKYTVKVSRHFDGLWFGPHTSTTEYINP